jgi:hypothetical protein
MVKIEDTVFCDACGVEMPLAPVVKNRKEYCCDDCAKGYECKCGEQLELDEQGRSQRSTDISTRGVA